MLAVLGSCCCMSGGVKQPWLVQLAPKQMVLRSGSVQWVRRSPEQVCARPVLVAAPLLLELLHCAGRSASGAGALPFWRYCGTSR